jgi:hypothetical protein
VNKLSRAIKGEDLFQDTKLENWKIETKMASIKKDLACMARQQVVIQQQLGSMEKGRGFSFWPKPILHPFGLVDAETPIILVKPCGFCKTWYNLYDIMVISCKHIYHSFCFGELFKNEKECYVYGDLFHPDWWTSFGIHERDEELHTQVKTM